MKTIKFCYVILHYKTIDDTIQCIESIEKYSNKDYKIVIVDNYSNNGSLQILNKKYYNDDKIEILNTKENLGFARGNNVGFEYAKINYKPDYIIMCNNDTLLLDDNFCENIDKIYSKEKFAVLGPKIILKDKTINPVKTQFPSLKTLKKSLIYKKTEYLVLKTKILLPIYDFFKKKRDEKLNKTYVDANVPHKDVILHGSFLIFSKKYIEKFDGLDPRTFLYREEELLYLRLKKYKLHNIYDPSIEIYHKEDGSTDSLYNSNIKKRLFVAKNQINSLNILIMELKNDEGGK